jgi:hypothetical protein
LDFDMSTLFYTDGKLTHLRFHLFDKGRQIDSLHIYS